MKDYLEEAAEEYRRKTCNEACKNGFLDNHPSPSIKTAFIAGAKWDRSQMMKEAVEAHIYQSANPVSEIGHPLHQAALLYEDKENAPYLKAGDRVKLIIVKED